MPTATPVAQGSPAAATVSPGMSGEPSPPAPRATPSAVASGSPAASPSASAPPLASAPPPGTAASITYTQLRLDAKDDPDGRNRVVTFQTQGPGDITVSLASQSPGTTRMCLSIPDQALGCRSAADGGLTAHTTKPTEKFTLTLRGVAGDTPTVAVEITFPASGPSVTLSHARFDGTDFPADNGIQALVTPRVDGNLGLQAEWGGHPFLYQVTLTERGGPGSESVAPQETATGADLTLPVAAPNPWLLILANAEGGFGTTPLTATIAWP
jgi:hypothetical protein